MGGLFVWVVIICLWLVVHKVAVKMWWRPRRIGAHFARQGIRGPPYQLFVGNMKELVCLMLKASSQPMPLSHNILPRVLSFYHHWKKIYGGCFLMWFGPTPRLVVSDPSLIRQVFSSKADLFEKYESHSLVRDLEGDGLLSLKGDKWAHHRKIISPTFYMENLALMMPVMAKSVAKLLQNWNRLSRDGEVEIEVSECFHTLTEEVITGTVFGSSYEAGKAIFQLQTEQMVYAVESFQKIFIPGYRFLPTKKNMISWKLDKEIRKALTTLVDTRRESSGKKSSEDSPRDLLELMIQANLKVTTDETCSTFTINDIVEECKGFFFAGKHTTSNLLTWTTIMLAMHPEWQESAREEILMVCESRDVPTKDDITKFKKLGMIVNESLRLYPPAVATIRRAVVDVDLGGCKIPCGTELLIPIIGLHHDAKLWGRDANEFNPSRFAHGSARASSHPTAFIPFGLGARRCIGQNLATLQTKLAVSMIIRDFSIELSANYKHAPTVLMLLHPQYGAPLKFRKLSKPMSS